MTFLNRCNGYGTQLLTVAAQKAIMAVVTHARYVFREETPTAEVGPCGKYEYGHRFWSDRCVCDRIAHVATEAEVLADPLAWALDALRDCAAADYWYEHEKNWD